MNNRHTCASCRLAKCLMNGMRIEMIRASRCKKNRRNRKQISNNDLIRLQSTTSNKNIQIEQVRIFFILFSFVELF